MKKDSANAGFSQILEATVGAFLLSALLFILFSYGKQTILYSKTEALARECVSAMETTGYLTDDMKNTMTKSLEKLGFKNIDYTGTSLTKQNNGLPVTLKIQCEYSKELFSMNFIKLTKTDKTSNITIKKSSISKCN